MNRNNEINFNRKLSISTMAQKFDRETRMPPVLSTIPSRTTLTTRVCVLLHILPTTDFDIR